MAGRERGSATHPCILCQADTRVLRTDRVKRFVRRWRECTECDHRYHTEERAVGQLLSTDQRAILVQAERARSRSTKPPGGWLLPAGDGRPWGALVRRGYLESATFDGDKHYRMTDSGLGAWIAQKSIEGRDE